MRWIRRVASVAVMLCVAATGAVGAAAAPAATTAGGAHVDPAIGLDTALPDQMLDAVVVLKKQADLGAITARTRRQRLADVERALRDTAIAGQRDVMVLLRARQAEHRISAVTPLWIADEVAISATPSVIEELAARGDVREIRADVTVTAPPPPPGPRVNGVVAATTTAGAAAESNLGQVNAPALWDLGFRGQGVVVANLDTGVDVTHPELAARWRGGTNSWFDPNGQHPTSPVDVNGHGTWTMGVMVAGDAGGSSIGMAPEASWIAAKIFNDRGVATTTGIHRAFQWLLDPDGNVATADAPNVVNSSWTTSSAACVTEFQPDLRALRAVGILPVFAAGNGGPTTGTVFSPANLPEAFAVGAVDGADVVDPYSSRGPSSCAQAVSPALTAPGQGIRTTDLYGYYAIESGTSMAAPHVAGGLALLLSAFGDLAADRQQAALENGALELGSAGTDNDYGHGRLDVLAAYHWLQVTPDFQLSASPASVTAPAGTSASYSVTVTPANGFTGDVLLTLGGLPAGQAEWSFAPPTIPGGSGTSQLTVTSAATLASGTYPLTLTGTSGSVTRATGVTLVVPAPPDFTLTAGPASATVAAGSAAGYTVGVTAKNGFTGVVSLTLSGLPAAVGTAAFTPATITAAGSSHLTITTATTAPPGTYPLTVTGSSESTTHSATVTLTVTPAPDFGLSVSPAAITVSRGQTASYTVTVSSVGGFGGGVTLSQSGVPSRTTVTWSSNPVAAPGTSTLQVRTTSSTPRGTFTVRVTGTSGSLSHQSSATLTVR
jgi:hypothetical protein